MATTYTDEELYMRYRATAASDAAAAIMVAEHRARYSEDDIATGAGVWAETSLQERRTAVLQALPIAALLPNGAERTGLIAHALRGALAGV